MTFKPGGKKSPEMLKKMAAARAGRARNNGSACTADMTLVTYNQIVAAYRDVGYRYREVARRVGCRPSAARRAWHQGWPELGLAPIQTVVIEERNDARVKLKELEAQELAQKDFEARRAAEERYHRLRQQVVDARAEEAMMVATARRNIIETNQIVGEAIPAALTIVRRIRAMAEDPNTKIGVLEGATVLNRIASAVGTLTQAGVQAQTMERELLGSGEATKPGDVLDAEGESVDLDALVSETDSLGNLLRRARERTALRLVQGEKKELPETAGTEDVSDVVEVQR